MEKVCYNTKNLNSNNVPLLTTHKYTNKQIINKYHNYNTKTQILMNITDVLKNLTCMRVFRREGIT